MGIHDSEVIIVPGLAVADATELGRLDEWTLRERQWYADHPSFADFDAIQAAVGSGRLVQVEQDDNIALVGRMRTPKLYSQFTPYLLPGARDALQAIGRLWRSELLSIGIDSPELRLSIASLARSEERQKQLVKDPAKLASDDSTHCKAGAFDIDASAYYLLNDKSIPVPIMHPGRSGDGVKRIAKVLMDTVGPEDRYEPPEVTAEYNPLVTDALVTVADRLHEAGLINRILEYATVKPYNRCLHIAPQPGVVLA